MGTFFADEAPSHSDPPPSPLPCAHTKGQGGGGLTSAVKRCPSCGETKDVSAFARNRSEPCGLQGHCRLCQSEYRKKARVNNRAKFIARDRQQRAEHRDEICEWNRRYRERHPEQVRKDWERCNANPKHKARRVFRKALQAGLIQRPDECSECGMPGFIHAHHADYAKPFEVDWLCPECHGKRHRRYDIAVNE